MAIQLLERKKNDLSSDHWSPVEISGCYLQDVTRFKNNSFSASESFTFLQF